MKMVLAEDFVLNDYYAVCSRCNNLNFMVLKRDDVFRGKNILRCTKCGKRWEGNVDNP